MATEPEFRAELVSVPRAAVVQVALRTCKEVS